MHLTKRIGLALSACAASLGGLLSPHAARAGDDRCGAPPKFATNTFLANFPTGRVAVETAVGHVASDVADPVLEVFNLAPFQITPPAGCYNPTPFRYARMPDWSRNRLGSVFGLTMDSYGNIYVARSSAHGGWNQASAFPGSTWGTIFKINSVTGLVSIFCNLPNTGPGLGNINFDCEHNVMFATNHEDGRIYRIDGTTGVALSSYDHALNVVNPNGLPNSSDPPGFVPLGDRLWAVQKHNDRVYYSVWGRGLYSGTIPNTIYSIKIGPTGDFIAGTRQLELTLPNYAGSPGSYPVSDISFSPDCKMLVAERSMDNDYYPNAHAARVMEYEKSGGTWVQSAANTNIPASGFPVGAYLGFPPSDGTNAAGGCDYDWYFPLPTANARGVYATSDYIASCSGGVYYGFTGMLRAGASYATSTYCDYGFSLTTSDKTKQGDIEISVDPACIQVVNETLVCRSNTTSGSTYIYQATFKNLSGTTITTCAFNAVSVPNTVTIAPSVQTGLSVPPNGTWVSPAITVSNVPPSGEFCMVMSPAQVQPEILCRYARCLTVPDCNCLQWYTKGLVCNPNGSTTMSFTVTNFSGSPMSSISFSGLPAGVTINPSTIPFSPALANLTNSGPLAVTIVGATPGSQLCFTVSSGGGAAGTQGCSTQICVTVPLCATVEVGNPCADTHLTTVTQCCANGGGAGRMTLRICNPTYAPATFNWSLASATPSIACPVVFPPSAISPNNGSVTLEPCACIDIPININCAQGSAGAAGCLQATITNTSTATTQTLFGILQRNLGGRWCWVIYCCTEVGIGHGGVIGTARFTGTYTSPDPANPTPGGIRYRVVDPSGLLSLNGLPPGVPVEGMATSIPGTPADVSISVACESAARAGNVDLLLVVDTNGDGEPDTAVESIPVSLTNGPGVCPPVLTDSFDDNTNLGPIAGQNGWTEFFGQTGVSANVVAQGNNHTQSLKIVGNPGGSTGHGNDVVLPMNMVGGHWTLDLMTFVPTNATGNSYVIMADQYPTPLHYGAWIVLDASANNVRNVANNLQRATLVRNQWVPLHIDVDLSGATNVTASYNGQQIYTGQSWLTGISFPGSAPVGLPQIAGIELYGGEPGIDGTTGMFYDDLVLTRLCSNPVGTTCLADIVAIGGLPPPDGILTGDDFNAFINAFAAGDMLADIVSIGGLPPGDNLITGDDFIAYINAFAQGCP